MLPDWHSPWFWASLGLLFIVAEVLISGEFFLWFGIAAFLTAPVAWLGASGTMQLASFAMLSVMAAVIFVWRWRRRQQAQQDAGLNDRLHGLVGEIGQVRQAIPAHGRGQVAVGGSLWSATADEAIAEGAAVRVRGVQGLLLQVEPIDTDQTD